MIYLIAGHNGPGTGAHGVNGTDEGEMTIELRDDLAQILRCDGVDVTVDDERMKLRNVLTWLGSIVGKKDIVIDIHFNAFSDKNAHGTEVFIPATATPCEKYLAYDLLQSMCHALGTRSRGVKVESSSQHRRIGILSGAPRAATNVLIEVCFITNENDVKKYDENYGDLLKAITSTLKNYVN